MKILLTGSSGFIGRNIKEHLKKSGHTVYTPSHNELPCENTGAVEYFFATHQVDFIIHGASVGGARGISDPTDTVELNIAMLNNLLQHKDNEARLITFGSGAQYDRNRDLVRVNEKESGKHTPTELYGLSKIELANIIEKRDDALMLIIFACYGKYEKESRLPSYCLKRAMHGLRIELSQDCLFDFLYIEDFLKIVDHYLMHKSKYHLVNVTPDESVHLSKLAKIASKVAGREVEISFTKQGQKFSYSGDNERLHNEIKNIKFTTLKEGLSELHGWLANSIDR